jgi:hypothetical protein
MDGDLKRRDPGECAANLTSDQRLGRAASNLEGGLSDRRESSGPLGQASVLRNVLKFWALEPLDEAPAFCVVLLAEPPPWWW